MVKYIPLTAAFLQLKTAEEIQKFLRDLCTPKELREFEQRWEVCQLLYAGQLSYREIAGKTGASVTTITRVARFLRDEPHQGYNSVLEKFS